MEGKTSLEKASSPALKEFIQAELQQHLLQNEQLLSRTVPDVDVKHMDIPKNENDPGQYKLGGGHELAVGVKSESKEANATKSDENKNSAMNAIVSSCVVSPFVTITNSLSLLQQEEKEKVKVEASKTNQPSLFLVCSFACGFRSNHRGGRWIIRGRG